MGILNQSDHAVHNEAVQILKQRDATIQEIAEATITKEAIERERRLSEAREMLVSELSILARLNYRRGGNATAQVSINLKHNVPDAYTPLAEIFSGRDVSLHGEQIEQINDVLLGQDTGYYISHGFEWKEIYEKGIPVNAVITTLVFTICPIVAGK